MSSQLPIKLEDLLRQRTVEGDRVEYKAGWNPDSILRTVCAFANDFQNLGGGYIVIGQDCDEAGQAIFPPKGLERNQIDRIQRELLGYCKRIQPPYFPLLSIERYEGRILLVLWVPGGQTRPYKVPAAVTAKKSDHRYFIRRYASTIEANGEDERELISLTATVPFDDRTNPQAAVGNLSPRLMAQYLAEVGSALAVDGPVDNTEALGRQMNVVRGPQEAPLPVNVGLLFFSDEPRRFFPATQIDVVYFPNGAGGDQFEEKVFSGPLAQITRDAISFIQRNYLKETVIKHPDRPEAERLWNFPLAAIEEAVVNAVYHRSYEIREPVEVRISQDDLVVLSFPGPDRSIRLSDLSAGRGISRRYRNRRIGEFLKELDLTEGRSTGIRKILTAMERNGSPAPEFETDDDRSYFLIRLPVHERAIRVDDIGAYDKDQVTPEVTPEVTPQVTPQVQKLLVACEGTLGGEELRARTGIGDREYFRTMYLRPAIDQGLIEMTIPDKPRSSKQQYRLTDVGRRWLNQHGDRV